MEKWKMEKWKMGKKIENGKMGKWKMEKWIVLHICSASWEITGLSCHACTCARMRRSTDVPDVHYAPEFLSAG